MPETRNRGAGDRHGAATPDEETYRIRRAVVVCINERRGIVRAGRAARAGP